MRRPPARFLIMQIAAVVMLLGAITAVSPAAAFASSGVPHSAAATSTLKGGHSLKAGQQIKSPNGTYRLIMQRGGNLVEYRKSAAVWATGTSGSGNHVTMQTDGNLVVYNSGGSSTVAIRYRR